MTEPRVQYVKSRDGTNIAYAVFGTGPAIVLAGSLWGDIHIYRSNPAIGDEYGRYRWIDSCASSGRSVIIYDSRGMGLSDRDTDDWTFEGRMRDLEAVIERAAPERFAVCGMAAGGPLAIAYTAQHADRISRLILANSYASGAEWYTLVSPMRLSQQTLADSEKEWDFYLLTMANAIAGYRDSDYSRRLADVFKAGMDPRAHTAFRQEAEKIDVRPLLSMITAPTLVIRDLSTPLLGAITQRLAAAIPSARYIETDDLANAVEDFLREDGEASSPDTQTASGMTAILFADIADSTALTESLGDAAFRERARDLDSALRTIIREHTGTPIEGKLLGDGVLATFASAAKAIEAALACGRAGGEAGLPLHLGLHAGDVIREDNNVYGGAVNIAARISTLSAPGEVLVSRTVADLARTSAGVSFEDRGEHALRGIVEAQNLFAVRQIGE